MLLPVIGIPLLAAELRLQTARAEGLPSCLLFIDLDYFKQLNDAHGHEAADAALRRTGRSIRERLDGDSVGARIGGEEFVCLIPGVSMREGRRFAERLRSDLATAKRPSPSAQAWWNAGKMRVSAN